MRIEKNAESPKPLTAGEIPDPADGGEEVSSLFTGKGKMMPPMPSSTEDEGNGQND